MAARGRRIEWWRPCGCRLTWGLADRRLRVRQVQHLWVNPLEPWRRKPPLRGADRRPRVRGIHRLGHVHLPPGRASVPAKDPGRRADGVVPGLLWGRGLPRPALLTRRHFRAAAALVDADAPRGDRWPQPGALSPCGRFGGLARTWSQVCHWYCFEVLLNRWLGQRRFRRRSSAAGNGRSEVPRNLLAISGVSSRTLFGERSARSLLAELRGGRSFSASGD